MIEKDIRFENTNISNRRKDDIVIIIKHDFSIESHKNQIMIEYLNDYGSKFFNIPKEKIIEDGSGRSENVLFGSILSQKTKQMLYEQIEEESNNEKSFEFCDLAYIMKKISNFTVLNGSHEQILVTVRIFHLYQNEHLQRKKKINTYYYYLIVRSATLEMRLADFRMDFLDKIGAKISLDDFTNIHTISSTVNELKMIIKYNNSHKAVDVIISLVEINKFYHDKSLMASVVNSFVKNTRVEDFIGHFSDNQFIVIFYDMTIDNGIKPLTRLYNMILSNNYVFTKYHNQKNEILAMSYTALKKGDDITQVETRLKNSIEESKHKTEGVKIVTNDSKVGVIKLTD